MLRQESLIQSLVKPVVRAFAKAGFSQKELLSGEINHTDLVWQGPALLAEAPLEGVPLHFYLNKPVRVNVERLHMFWCDSLAFLRNAPYKVLNEEGYKQLSYVLPGSSIGERSLRFSTPEGFPNQIGDYAGVTLSLECAHVLEHCTPVRQVVSDNDNYWVETEEGLEIGVRDGLPIIAAEEWDLPVNGLVQELLHMPRGLAFQGCDFDLVSKLRSMAHDAREKLPEFEGIDAALQALRVAANGKHVGEIQTQVGRIKTDRQFSQHKIRVFRECVELSKVFTISDRARVKAIYSLLVPDFMPGSAFSKNLYYEPTDVPATIAEKALLKLQRGLETLLAEEERKHGR